MVFNDLYKEIFFERTKSIVLPELTTEQAQSIPSDRQKQLGMMVATNFATYNFILSPQDLNSLCHAEEKDIVDFYNFYMPLFKNAVGADFEERRVFYPDFETSVPKMDRFDIFLDQLFYAYSGFSMMPEEKPDMSYFPYIGEGIKKPLKSGNINDFKNLIKDLFSQNMVFSMIDKYTINKIFSTEGIEAFAFLPTEPVKAKENNIYLLNKIKELSSHTFDMYAPIYLKTPTDVLRYAVSLVGGDPALNGRMENSKIGFSFSRNPKYPEVTRSLTRKEGKLILELLDKTNMDISEDYPQLLSDIKLSALHEGRNYDVVLVDDAVQTYASYYKGLAKVLHINPEKSKSKTVKVLDAICKNKTKTIFSLIENAIKDNDVERAVKYLSYRPTELLKRFDKLSEIAAKTNKEDFLCDTVEIVASKASVSTILQLYGLFESRKVKQDHRAVIYDGKVAEKKVKEALDAEFCDKIKERLFESLKEKFKDTKYLGKVYVEDSFSKIKIPKNDKLRDASEALYPYTYGSSLPNTKTNTKQFAIAWEDGCVGDKEAVVDIDLSAQVITKNGNDFVIAWDRDYSENGIVYSGDIRKGGSAEFINVDLEKLRENGVALVPSVNLYSIDTDADNFDFSSLLDAKMIIAERNDMDYGKRYEGKSVKFSLKLNQPAEMISPVVLDVETGEFIWMDLTTKDKVANVASYHSKSINQIAKEALFINKYNPGFDVLIKAHNCDIVDNIDEADIVFTQEAVENLKPGVKNITQNDLSELMKLLDIEEEKENSIDLDI